MDIWNSNNAAQDFEAEFQLKCSKLPAPTVAMKKN